MKKILVWATVLMMMAGVFSAFAAEEYSCDDMSGFYDIVFEFADESEVDESMTVILTPNGCGRMNTSDYSVTFDYYIDGNYIRTSYDDLFMMIESDQRIVFHLSMEGISMDLPYIKRENVNAEKTMTGKWELTGMQQGTTVYSEYMLDLIGVEAEMTCYENGTVDWYAKTDSVSNVAQGWGTDALGLYLQNGSERQRITIDKDTLKMVSDNSGGQVTYVFTRVK